MKKMIVILSAHVFGLFISLHAGSAFSTLSGSSRIGTIVKAAVVKKAIFSPKNIFELNDEVIVSSFIIPMRQSFAFSPEYVWGKIIQKRDIKGAHSITNMYYKIQIKKDLVADSCIGVTQSSIKDFPNNVGKIKK